MFLKLKATFAENARHAANATMIDHIRYFHLFCLLILKDLITKYISYARKLCPNNHKITNKGRVIELKLEIADINI